MASVEEDKVLSGSVKATDINNDALSYAVGQKPTSGSVTVNADGSYSYTPNANYNGADSFTVTVSDGKGGTATQTVKVTVNAVNDAPTYSAAELSPSAIAEDSALVGSVKATDLEGDSLTYAVGATKPANGSVVVNADGTYVYTPAKDFNGSDSFTVTASDGKDGSATQAVKVTITAVNDAPVVTSSAQAGSVTEDATLTAAGKVTVTDVDNGATAAFSGDKAGSYGNFAVNASTGVWTYTLNNAGQQALAGGESHTETFKVTVTDDKGATATQDVVVTVNGANDAPVVTSSAQAGSVTEDATLTATGKVTVTDVDNGATAAFSGDKAGSYGNFAVNASTGVWTYTLNNAGQQALAGGESHTETFNVTVTDDKGATATQDVVVTVNGANDAPVVTSAEQAGSVTEDATLTVTGKVTVTDVDNGATAAFSGDKAGTYGNFAVNASTGVWTYTLNNAAQQGLDEGESHTETFKVTVTDDKAATATQDVVVTVHGTNDLPVVSASADRSVSFQEAAPTALVASSQFANVAGTDADGGTVTFSVPTETSVATLSLAADGSGFTYTPKDINYHGTETITVRLNDAQGAGKYTDYQVQVTVGSNTAENQGVDNGLTKAFFDADGSGYTSGDNFKYIDNSSVSTNVEIANFRIGDTIQVSASASNYSFAVTGSNDLEITYYDATSGANNVIVLKGVAAGAGFIDDEATAEAQLNLGNFFGSATDGSTSGGTSSGAGLDADTDGNVATFALFDAAGRNAAYTDDANVANRALVQHFTTGDTITVSNAPVSDYTFSVDDNAGHDVIITLNNGGVINEIVLQGVASGYSSLDPIDTLAEVEALVGVGFFTSTVSSGGGSGGAFMPTNEILIDNGLVAQTLNAADGSIKYVDNVGLPSNVIIQNFSSNDRIYTNALEYNFARNGDDEDDLEITFGNNLIYLDEFLAGHSAAFIENYATAKDAVGFDFMVFG